MRTRTDVHPLKGLALCCAISTVLSANSRATQTFAQTATATPSGLQKTETITADVIAARQKDAAQAKDLDDATRAKTLELYHQAAESLTAAEGFAKQAGESKGAAAKAVQIATDMKAEQKRLRENVQLLEAAGRSKQPDSRAVGA